MIKFTNRVLFVNLLIFKYMSGFFGVVSKTRCVEDVFYGTDYHSHLGTKRAGMVFIVPEKGFRRSIHSLENAYFRNKFEEELKDFSGNSGMGIISDTDPDTENYKNMVKKVAENLDLNSLLYQRLDDLVDAIGLPKEKLCTHCWDGTSYF